MPPPVMLVPSSRLSSVDCGSVTAPDIFPAAVGDATEEASTRGSADAADSWSVLLLPTFIILDSVDLRLEDGSGMGAYSCADGMGGGKNGDPGDGKGDEEDSLLMVTVSEGVSERGRWVKGVSAMDGWTHWAQTFCLRGDDG
jgi:hypothetical protein